MRKNFYYFFIGSILAASPLSLQAATTATSVSTVPEGFFSFSLPTATFGSASTSTYLSLPLSNSPTYSGSVSSVTANSITVDDSPAPWTSGSLAAVAAPYFVKFLSGAETGRVVKVTANSTNSLTLDTTDNSLQTVALTASGFAVQAGDTFEVFAGDTLASVFGANSTASPLVVTSGTSTSNADTVAVYNTLLARWQTYYFDSSANYWKLYGSTTNANSTVLYPYGAMTITRHAKEKVATLVLTGRVAEVAMLTKTTGSDANVYSSTKYASDMKLSQIDFGTNWTQSTSAYTADNLAVWDATMTRFDTYYQLPDSTWRKSGSPTTDASSLVVPAGTVVSILKRSAVSGATSFLQAALPYSVD